MSSPKRKSTVDPPSPPAKKLRFSPPPLPPTNTTTAATIPPAPDSHIDPARALAYWSATAPTVAGVLGGYPHVSRADLQGSRNFLAKLLRTPSRHGGSDAKPSPRLRRAVDCGAGIGRVTQGLLVHVAECTDIVEPVAQFTAQIAGRPGVGQVYNVGLAEWTPEVDEQSDGRGARYDLVWNQWCVGQLTDAQLTAYLASLPAVLAPGGWIVVKENLSNDAAGCDVYDETDSSVTRTDAKFRALFAEARLRVVASELQRGLPKELYPVRSYALQPM
nr:alpha n-terminal protein methyltransferase 1 [Quercus suber]